jgi:hypothetical protein
MVVIIHPDPRLKKWPIDADDEGVSMQRVWVVVLIGVAGCQGASVIETQLGSSTGEESCTLTKQATSFPSSTRQVFFRFVATATRPTETLLVEWISPRGDVAAEAPYEQLPLSRSLCLLAQLPVGGFAAGRTPGQWKVRVTAAGRELASRPFTIVSDSGANGPQITNVVTKEISPEENEVVIDGVGFNTESIVHLAQYTNTGGWHYLKHTFPLSLTPSRAVIRVSHLGPAEYVVFVKNGERLSEPGRFLIYNAGGYRMPFPPHEQWVVSQPPYGMYSHWGRTLHAFDIAPRSGGCVVAMRSGLAHTYDLRLGQTPNRRIFGNYITLEHDNGEFSHYGHLRTGTFRVRNGERVEQGQALAIAGNSGYSFGTHVHVQVTKSFGISSPSIPFELEELPAKRAIGFRGGVTSVNRSELGDCGSSKKAPSNFLSTSLEKVRPVAAAQAATWTGSVPIAGWWSELTQVPVGTRSLDIRLGWDSPDRDLDLHLVSPSGRHYGSYGDRNGYVAGISAEESFTIHNPEPGTWRVSVQGIRGNGESMIFRVYRSINRTPMRAGD